MRSGTSGLMFTQNKDGSIRLEVVDYDVEEFGGSGNDWECWFELEKENADKLFSELRKLHEDSFEKMLIEEFGEEFSIPAFKDFCKSCFINYHYNFWS